MKRKKKLLTLLAVLAVIVGAAFGAARLNPDNQEAAEEELDTVVYSLEADAAESLSWTKDGEILSFVKSGETWVYETDNTFPLDETAISAMLSQLSEVSSTKTIEAVEDVTQYGLEDPVCTVTVTTDEITELRFGDETSLGGERYLSIGDGNVYLVDSNLTDIFDYDLYDMVKKESIPSMNEVTAFELVSDTENYVIEHLVNSGLAYSDEYEWFMQSDDGYLVLDNELTTSLIQNITGLVWGECMDYSAGQNLAAYGLDTPVATAAVHYIETAEVETNETDEDGNVVYETIQNEKTFVLEMGDYYGEGCYARISGSDMVYLIDAMICDTLLYMSYADLYPADVLVLNEETLTGVEIMLDGKTYTVDKVTRDVTNEDGETSKETVYMLDDSEIEFEDVLDTLTDLTSSGYAGDVLPERALEISIVIHQDDEDHPEIELSVYQYDNTNCLVTLNGESTVFVSREEIESLIDDIGDLISNE